MGYSIGYIRVSSADQNTARQLAGIKLDKVFTDKCSGGTTNRPQLQEMLRNLHRGDTIYVHEISRLARNLTDLLELIAKINGEGVSLVFVKDGITYDKEDKNQKLILSIMGAVATFERDMIRERQAEGIAIAKTKGAYSNRKQSKAVNTEGIQKSLEEGLSVRKTATTWKVAPSTVSRIKKAMV